MGDAGATGLTALDTAAIWAGAITAVVGLFGMLWRIARPVRRVVVRVDQFIDDWQGIPTRPGVLGRPGVMARLDAIERTVGTVAYEVRPNGGGSLRDAINRVDQRTAAVEQRNDQ